MPCAISMIKRMIIPELLIMGGTFLFIIFLLGGIRYIISGDKLFVKIWVIPYLISPVREQEFKQFLNIPVKKGIWRIQDWDI